MILCLFNAAGCVWLGWFFSAHGNACMGAAGYVSGGIVFGLGYADWCLRRVFERGA